MWQPPRRFSLFSSRRRTPSRRISGGSVRHRACVLSCACAMRTEIPRLATIDGPKIVGPMFHAGEQHVTRVGGGSVLDGAHGGGLSDYKESLRPSRRPGRSLIEVDGEIDSGGVGHVVNINTYTCVHGKPSLVFILEYYLAGLRYVPCVLQCIQLLPKVTFGVPTSTDSASDIAKLTSYTHPTKKPNSQPRVPSSNLPDPKTAATQLLPSVLASFVSKRLQSKPTLSISAPPSCCSARARTHATKGPRISNGVPE